MPTILARALTTLARAKIYFGLGSDKYDGVLIMLINQATGFIERYTKRKFLETDYSTEQYDGTGTNSLILKQYPVTAMTLLEYNQAEDNTDDWASFDSNEYFWEEGGLIKLVSGKFLDLPQKYRATYTAGYKIDFDNEEDSDLHTLPFEVENVCLRLVSALFNRRKAEGFSTTKIGDLSVTLNKTVMDDAEVRAILDKYTNPSI